jgi:hypothetical protein
LNLVTVRAAAEIEQVGDLILEIEEVDDLILGIEQGGHGNNE